MNRKIGQKNNIAKMTVSVAGLVLILAGCGVGRESAAEGPSENGVVAAVDTPLRAPAWAADEGVVIALQEGGDAWCGSTWARASTGRGTSP